MARKTNNTSDRQKLRLEALAKKPSNKYAAPLDSFKKIIKAENRRPSVRRERPIQVSKTVRIDKQLNLLFDIPAFVPGDYSEYPVPSWFRTTEKADVSVIVPMFKSDKVIVELIQSWHWENDLKVEIIFVDDQCPTGSKFAVLKTWDQIQPHRPVGKLFVNQENQGYGATCNVGAANATGDYLIFLNADTILSPNWIKPLIDRFKSDPTIGIVGNLQIKQGGEWDGHIDSAGSEWRWDHMNFIHIGRHSYRHKDLPKPATPENAPQGIMTPGPREMVTGCCLAIRRDLFLDLGGFNPNYRIGYWEDSELCMAVKERGLQIFFEPSSVIYHKLGHSNAGAHRYHEHNKNYFMNKWVHSNRINPFVSHRADTNPVTSILLKRSGANGDVLMAAAVAAGLKKKYPGVKITFCTHCTEVLQNNPDIDKVITTNDRVSQREIQIFYDMDMAYEYRPKTNILQAYADLVGVPTEDCRLYMDVKNPDASLPSEYVVIHPGITSWVGRNWTVDNFDKVGEWYASINRKVVCVGNQNEGSITCDLDLRGKLTIAELAYVIKNAKEFVGIDSFPMHVAQTFDIPGVCFFGSVNPDTRIVSKKMQGVQAEGLSCLGCHHRKPAPSTCTNICETGTQECVTKFTSQQMIDILKK